MENLALDNTFWKNKKVFLTGHTGFKGSWLSLWLQQLGANTTGYSLAPNTSPNLFTLCEVQSALNHHIGDIRNLTLLKEKMQSAAPEIIIHMAAQPLVRYSYDNPIETYETNVMGTLNLLESVRSCPSVKSVVIVTTDKCYENKEWLWGYRENESLGGYDPYSSSKACAELVTQAYRNSYFNIQDPKTTVFIASARAGNVIGGGDWSQDRLVPDILSAIEKNRTLNIRSPHALRPWQHVLEPLHGYLCLAQNLYKYGAPFAEAWNFGPYDQDVKNVGWITSQLLRHFQKESLLHIDSSQKHPHEAKLLKLDSSKAINKLYWSPKWSLNHTLNKIAEWHQTYLTDKTKVKNLTQAQIKEFMEFQPSR